ncbi:DNA polymerase III subunit delta [Legionella brunensis]|uniref:DNA polymerase III subunit delta n=1 Tax=Legionella brunensis TaxID=29422 RepID=A0A0W0S3X7_9GAMM|nr:DNA polymerase III subunit delta [Legionella brunensis]KTC78279.1 DNA polymerase III, delta subunit [Legionella brunensis]
MLIKQQALNAYLAQHAMPAIYLLIGQDHFLLTEAVTTIKQAWRKKDNDMEETVLHISNPADWSLVNEKANSYTLFSTHTLIDIRYEKQTLDTAGKNFINTYLKNTNPFCLLLIRAPNLPVKQLQSFSNSSQLHTVQIFPLDAPAIQRWIKEQLQQKCIKFEPEIPALIHQYTQGNMLACAQALEKIQLIADDSVLTIATTKEQLIDQCNYQLFDLSDACLLQDTDKVIQHLRHAYNSDVEATLILWLLSQDIRHLIRLHDFTQQAIPFATACNQLKIWSQRSKLYQVALRRVPKSLLIQLLQFCKKIDEQIKSSQNSQVWPSLEKVALSLCLGKQVGSIA